MKLPEKIEYKSIMALLRDLFSTLINRKIGEFLEKNSEYRYIVHYTCSNPEHNDLISSGCGHMVHSEYVVYVDNDKEDRRCANNPWHDGRHSW
jgi:hypothetical protein